MTAAPTPRPSVTGNVWAVTVAVWADGRATALRGISTVQQPKAAAADVLCLLWPATDFALDWNQPSSDGKTGGTLNAAPAEDVPALPGWTVRVEVSQGEQ